MKAAAVALALLTIAAAAPARTLTDEKLGVALDVPDGWADSAEIARAVRPPRELIAGFASPDGQRTVIAFCSALEAREAGDYTRGLLDELRRQGYTVGANMPVALHGVNYDSYTGTPAGASVPILQFFSTFANGRAFAVSLNQPGGDPTRDAELQSIVRSFRFLTPPKAFAIGDGGYRGDREGSRKFSKLSLIFGLPICAIVLAIGVLALLRKK